MNLRHLSTLLFLAMTISLGYGATPGGGNFLDDMGDNQFSRTDGFNKNIVIVNPRIPGNAIEGGATNALPTGNVITAPVPEPSTIALVCVSLLGLAALKLRRQRSAD
jgi:hypothetical protein